MMRARGIQGRLMLVITLTLLAGSIALVSGFDLVLRARLDASIDDVLTSRASAQLATLETSKGQVIVGEAPDDGSADVLAWTYAPDGHLLEGPTSAPPRVTTAARNLARSGGHAYRLEGDQVRFRKVDARRGGRTIANVVVAVSTTPYRRTERTALGVAIGIAIVLVFAALGASSLLLRAILAPIARMTADAAAWSENDLERRFAQGPPRDELTRLAATFDAMLDRVAAGIRRERRLSDEVSHELRTPLTRLSTQAQLLRDDPELPAALQGDAAGIVESAAALQDVVETLLAAARAGADGSAPGVADAREVIDQVVARVRSLAADQDVQLAAVRPSPDPVLVAAEPLLLERILMPLVENACRYARARATISVVPAEPGWVEVTVSDDGPGIEADEREVIFEPGIRGRAGSGSPDGSGLGLALARRLSRSVEGEVRVESSTRSGATFVIRLPAA